MRVESFTPYAVRLPLRKAFAHASHRRTSSDNLVVCCRLADGTEGWGEGVPRDYVTGETLDTALATLQLSALAEQLTHDCHDWSGVLAGCQALKFPSTADKDDPRDCRSNAVRCAVELSLLDAYGKFFGEPVSAAVAHFPVAASILGTRAMVRYSTTIATQTVAGARLAAIKMRLYGFGQCKVKVGLADGRDLARVRTIRRWLGRRVDLRVDANEAWSPDEAARRIAELSTCHISSVEQPVPHAEIAALAGIRGSTAVPIMLDESLTSPIDAQTAIDAGTCDLFNIRLSKCGGFLRSLQIAALARQAGLGYQLGCHPGESGVLSAAGRHWATAVAGIRYLEGSYDRHLLVENITREDLTFGYGGRAPALTAPGLGIEVDRAALDRCAIQNLDALEVA